MPDAPAPPPAASVPPPVLPVPAAAHRPLRLALVMSTEVGMRTQYLNWRAALDVDGPALRVDPVWTPITWWQSDGRLEQLPLLPHAAKTRLRCFLEMQAGLSQAPFDALLAAMPELFRWRAGA